MFVMGLLKKERTPGFPHGQTQELFTRQSGNRRYLKKNGSKPNLDHFKKENLSTFSFGDFWNFHGANITRSLFGIPKNRNIAI